jgi:MFS transporter, ACS family, hexuronate transporter
VTDASGAAQPLPPAASPPRDHEAAESGWWKWKVCAFLTSATALSYLDRQSLSTVAPLVQQELRLSQAELGFLLSAFFWAYSLMHLGVGWFLDRLNIRFTYGAFVALWSVSQVASGFAGGLVSLAATRMTLGTFEAAGQPGAARIIARIVSGPDRTLANGLMMSGGSIGAMIAPILVIWLATTIGWRAGFIVLGCAGLAWAAAWVWWFRPGHEVLYGPRQGSTQLLTEADQWRVIRRSPRFWACIAAAAFGVPILHVSASWVPTYFVQQWQLPISTGLGVYLFVIYLGLDIGFIGQGAIVRALAGLGWSMERSRKAVLGLSGALMLAAVLVPVAPSAGAAVLLVFLLNVGRAAWGAIFLSLNQDIAPARVATIAGIMGAVGAFSGASMIWAIGILSQRFGLELAFNLVGVCVVFGLLPLLLVRWEHLPAGARHS